LFLKIFVRSTLGSQGTKFNLREEVDSLHVEIKVLKKQKHGLLENQVDFETEIEEWKKKEEGWTATRLRLEEELDKSVTAKRALDREIRRMTGIIRDLEQDKKNYQSEIAGLLIQLTELEKGFGTESRTNIPGVTQFVGRKPGRGRVRSVFLRLFEDAIQRLVRYEQRRALRSSLLAEEFGLFTGVHPRVLVF